MTLKRGDWGGAESRLADPTDWALKIEMKWVDMESALYT